MSTISPKQGICPRCTDGKLKPLIGGLCQSHYWAERRKVSVERKEKRNRIVRKKPLVGIFHSSDLSVYYMEQIRLMDGKCEECGGPINKNFIAEAIAAVAHIFPKAKFDSIKTHPLNRRILCATNGCHSRFDVSWESASKMKVWTSTAEIIMKLKDEVDVSERGKVYDTIIHYAEQSIKTSSI